MLIFQLLKHHDELDTHKKTGLRPVFLIKENNYLSESIMRAA